MLKLKRTYRTLQVRWSQKKDELGRKIVRLGDRLIHAGMVKQGLYAYQKGLILMTDNV